MNKFRILEVIGDGTYGVVYKGYNIETNEHVAIKKLKDKISSWNECLELNEVRVLRKLNHENIVKLHEIIREQNSDVSLIFEFADVNLYEYIDSFHKNNQYIPEHKIRNIIYQIIAGINYLHQHGIMHRDLKPENILIMKNTNQIKIADFGTAKEIPSFSSNSLTDYVCTRWYRAPECVLKSNEYNESIDVWAIGCVLVELYNLKPLFAGTSEFDQLDKICNILGTPSFNEWPEGFKYIQRLGMKFPNCNKKDLSNIIKNANQDAINLLKSIFVWNWKERPTCAELLNHRYFIENRPSTFSFGNRFERRGREFQNSRSNNNDYNNFNANTYRNERERNDLEMAKNGDNYLRNLNFWNYQNNGGFVSDLNNLFKKDPYINNMGYYIGKDKEKGNSNNNYLGNNNYGTSSTKSLYPMLFSTQNSKNKFSSLAESNIIMNRKFGRNSSFNPSLNQVNDYNNKNIVSKYKPINFYEEPLNNRNNNPYIPNYSKMFHKPTLEQLIPLGTKFNTNLYV